MDWSLCILCQDPEESEPLKCPLNAPGKGDKSIPYQTFLDRVRCFKELDVLPLPLTHFPANIEVQDLVQNKAKWHKICHLKFGQEKLEKARKRNATDTEAECSNRSEPKRFCPPRHSLDKEKCIFCEESSGKLHQFSTLEADSSIRAIAKDLENMSLLAKIEGGDLIALESKYHLSCLTSLRNRHRSYLRETGENSGALIQEKKIMARAFAEVLAHIEALVTEGNVLFKFSELRALYERRLRFFGIPKEINKVRFKEQILSHFPEAQAQSDGKNGFLVFEKGMQQIMKNATNSSFEDDAITLSKAARIIREDILNSNVAEFNGSFNADCQQQSVPTNVKYFVSMLLNGCTIEDQDSQSCLTISQMIVFNCKKRLSKGSHYHSRKFEPPLPLYVGLKIHTQTRSKKLVSEMYHLGLSVSYDRILELENHIASSLCHSADEIGLVCPHQLRHGLFTIGALDNLDHNPSSSTSKESFHGTGISLFQFPTTCNEGILQAPINIDSTTKKLLKLPDSYTVVPAVVMKKESTAVPFSSIDSQLSSCSHFNEAVQTEHAWLKHAMEALSKTKTDGEESISWAAYHASSCKVEVNCSSISQLMPLFNEHAASAAMIKHGISVQTEAIQFLNPGQIPVIAFDAPLFAIAKLVQWNWPDKYGENKCVAMMGGLHIEMAFWNTVGDYLEGSGWVSVLTQSGVALSGTAELFKRFSSHENENCSPSECTSFSSYCKKGLF